MDEEYELAAQQHALNLAKHDDEELAAIHAGMLALSKRLYDLQVRRKYRRPSMIDGPNGDGFGGLCDRDAS